MRGFGQVVFAVVLCAGSAVARADQCEVVDADAATWAQKIVTRGASVAQWCEPCGDVAPTDPQKVTAINWFGPLHMTHAVAKGMAVRKSGRIVNIASDAGRVGSTGEVVYSGCKGATISFAKALAREVARSNVTVNTVCPGPTDTPAMDAFVGTGEAGQKIRDAMVRGVPLGRIGQPDDYPGLVAFLASDDAAFMTGQTISVSGGLSMHG